ncbi:MAG TPA: hypothetical protein VFU02_05095 [Polyangiaceae bacterium]|nr:hypothetical protein [Polyangiaceae bacterium]
MKVLVAHSVQDAEFAGTFLTLLRDVIGLDAADIGSSSPAQTAAPVSARSASLQALAPVTIKILSKHSNQPQSRGLGPDDEPDSSSPGFVATVLLDGLSAKRMPASQGRVTVDGSSSFALEELFGHIAGRLEVGHALDLPPHRKRIEALASLARGRSGQHGAALRARLATVLGATTALLLAATYAWLYPPWGHGRIEFEDEGHGWSTSSDKPSACLGLDRSKAVARRGRYSLELDMDLDGSKPELASAEVWLDLRQQKQADLAHRRVSAWVYTPAAAVGDPEHPNGFQLFVKDEHWRSHYGRWVNAVADEWSRVELVVGEASHPGSVDAGFDATLVTTLGVKVSVGGGSHAVYTGPIYIDSVDW